MKELSIEEKAKRYDAAIERAKKVLLDCTPEERNVVEYISPELKSSEDERIRKKLIYLIEMSRDYGGYAVQKDDAEKMLAWIKKQDEQNPAWSEEDEIKLTIAQTFIRNTSLIGNDELKESTIDWLKELKERYIWKPSKEMLEALYKAIPNNVKEMSEDEMLLDKLYQGLKYGRVLSEN